MKKLITTLFLLSTMSVFAQDLPEANKKVLEYAKSMLGKKVGKGVCCELIDSALSQVNPDWYLRRYKTTKNLYGERVSKREVIAGDILLDDSDAGHLAIVSSVNPDGSVVVLNQNVRDYSKKYWSTYKDSKVVYLTYTEDSGMLKNVKFYRPR